MVVLSKPAAGDTDWTTEINDNWTAIEGLFPSICQGRLTLTSGTPITTSDVTAATTIYFAPYKGNRIALYDGTNWSIFSFTERSLAVPATTNTNYDVFIYDSSGTLTLEAVAWTNDTTRATALVLQDGVYVKSGATARRYVGSFRTTGTSGQTEDSGGQAAGTVSKRYVYNYYNRILRGASCIEDANSWTYTTDSWRQANNDATNQVEFVRGVDEDALVAYAVAMSDNTGNWPGAVGVGISSTTVNSARIFGHGQNTSASDQGHGHYVGHPGIGRIQVVWLERSSANNTTAWRGDNGVSHLQSGLFAQMWM